MPNVNGPGQWKRRLLESVTESQILYASPVWYNTVAASARTRRNLVRPQRAAAIRVIRAYRTISDEAALVLAAMPPVDLMGFERSRIRDRLNGPVTALVNVPSKDGIKREERSRTIDLWQAKWVASPKAAWTREAIPDLHRRFGIIVPLMPLSFHMTQTLTGHGCFQHYLFRMGHAISARCCHCDCDRDDVRHTLFECQYWSGFRTNFGVRLGHTPSAADIFETICGHAFKGLPDDPEEKAAVLWDAEETFRVFYRMVEDILSLKEKEERLRQAREPAPDPDA